MALGCIIICTIIGVPSLIVNTIVFILIMKATPKGMMNYRPYLIYSTIYGFLLSFELTVFFQPEVVFPAVGVKVSGLGKYFSGPNGGHYWLDIVCFTGLQIMFSLDLCISYRYYSLIHSGYTGKEFQHTYIFSIQFVSSYLADAFIIYSLHSFSVPLQEFIAICKENGRWFYIEEDIRMKRMVSGWEIKNLFWMAALSVATMGFLTYTVTKNIWMLHRLHVQLGAHVAQLSVRTHAMHKRLTYLVAMQILYPFACLSIPVLLFLISIGLDLHEVTGSKAFQWVLFGFVISLPLFNGISTLFGITPYRTAFFKGIESVGLVRNKAARIAVLHEPTISAVHSSRVTIVVERATAPVD